MDFGKILMRQGIFLGNFLCDRVQGVERFATHPRHFPSQVPPPPGPHLETQEELVERMQMKAARFVANEYSPQGRSQWGLGAKRTGEVPRFVNFYIE